VAALFLRNARLSDGGQVDVEIDGSAVRDVRPAAPVESAPGTDQLDLTGYLLLPAPAEPHAHLDKVFTWDRTGAQYGGLLDAVRVTTAASANFTAQDIRARALRMLRMQVRNGVTAVRTHANVCDGADPLLAVRTLVELREELRDRIDLQVAFLAASDCSDDQLREAVRVGVDQLGGAPHTWPPDPTEGTVRILRLAAETGVAVDLHVDEELDPQVGTLAAIARETVRLGLAGKVTASHCVSLGVQPGDVRDEAIAAVRAAGVGIVTNPITNLYLQGRGWPTSPPRGLTAVGALLEAGVTVAGGGDNVRDAFNPMGRGDPLEVAALLVTAGHLTVEQAYDAVSTGARTVLQLPAAGVAAGRAADLLAIRADALVDAIAEAPADRITIRAGEVIARTSTSGWSELD
jgi:cytosine deaminase